MAPAARIHLLDGRPAVTLSAGDLAATFVPELGMVGASLTKDGAVIHRKVQAGRSTFYCPVGQK